MWQEELKSFLNLNPSYVKVHVLSDEGVEHWGGRNQLPAMQSCDDDVVGGNFPWELEVFLHVQNVNEAALLISQKMGVGREVDVEEGGDLIEWWSLILFGA